MVQEIFCIHERKIDTLTQCVRRERFAFIAAPFPEGWYTYYAQCIQRGEVPYKDFEYLFPPLYLYLINFFTYIFGFDIISLRLLGVVIYTAIAIVCFLAFRVAVPAWIASIASITAVLYMQTEFAQTFYDYVRVMDLVNMGILFFALQSVRDIQRERSAKAFFCTGLICGLLFLIKQNTGCMVSAFSFLSLTVVVWYFKRSKEFFFGIPVTRCTMCPYYG